MQILNRMAIVDPGCAVYNAFIMSYAMPTATVRWVSDKQFVGMGSINQLNKLGMVFA